MFYFNGENYYNLSSINIIYEIIKELDVSSNGFLISLDFCSS
jgi:hypothetical protein